MHTLSRMYSHLNIVSRATSLGLQVTVVRTWVEGSQVRWNRALARASNLLGHKEYTQQDYQ